MTTRERGGSAGILTEDQWQQFNRDGYLRLGRVLDNDRLTTLRGRIDDIQVAIGDRGVQGLETDPMVLDLLRRDLFREACAHVYGRHASISIFRAMLMNQPPCADPHPWRQDAGDAWKLDRDPVLTSWIALDPATRRNGCLQAIPGSHRLGLLSRNAGTISEALLRRHCPDHKIVDLELDAGEAILLHNWMLRRNGIDVAHGSRRALSACYMDGRTLSTESGTRFPSVFGRHEDVETALPFLQAIKAESCRFRAMAIESERYAKSLLADNEQRELMRSEAERYARSLEGELGRIRRAF